MSGDVDRAAEAERLLADVGVRARVVSAGGCGDVALIRPAEDSLPEVLVNRRSAAVEACLAAGFRYVTLELC